MFEGQGQPKEDKSTSLPVKPKQQECVRKYYGYYLSGSHLPFFPMALRSASEFEKCSKSGTKSDVEKCQTSVHQQYLHCLRSK
jgi:hypothetical protein